MGRTEETAMNIRCDRLAEHAHAGQIGAVANGERVPRLSVRERRLREIAFQLFGPNFASCGTVAAICGNTSRIAAVFNVVEIRGAIRFRKLRHGNYFPFTVLVVVAVVLAGSAGTTPMSLSVLLHSTSASVMRSWYACLPVSLRKVAASAPDRAVRALRVVRSVDNSLCIMIVLMN
jgi:hypothetical protein